MLYLKNSFFLALLLWGPGREEVGKYFDSRLKWKSRQTSHKLDNRFEIQLALTQNLYVLFFFDTFDDNDTHPNVDILLGRCLKEVETKAVSKLFAPLI